MPKPDSLEIGIHKITCWFKDMQPAGVFFTNAIAIVNQKMPKVRYLAPFTVSLLTERTGDRLSYNDDVNPKNDWPRYICTPKEAEIFITGNAQRKFQKLEGEMSALLENIQGNKSFPTCRFWPNEVCFLGTKCCLQFYHDPKRPARSVRHREESDTADRNAPGMGNFWLNKSAPPPYVVYTPPCRHATFDTGRSCVNQPTLLTIQEDPVAGGASAMAIGRRGGSRGNSRRLCCPFHCQIPLRHILRRPGFLHESEPVHGCRPSRHGVLKYREMGRLVYDIWGV